jgi:hypothetical protein
MINEILNLMEEIDETIFDEGYALRDDGLYISIGVDAYCKPVTDTYCSFLYNKKEPGQYKDFNEKGKYIQ